MAGKSYKQLYEETKLMLDKYQDEIVPKLREQAQPLTEKEILALKAVAHGCNINRDLQHYVNATYKDAVSYADALVTVYELIERVAPDDSE